MEVPLSGPDITDREIELVNQVLHTRYLSLGPMLERFEEAMASYVGAPFAVGVSSGTAGLHLCIRAAGIGPGDEVITTPFSFIASANCILYEGAQPVFVDIDPHTLNIDPRGIEAKITPRTKALLPVHVFGQPCEMHTIMDIARRHGLYVIEDAAEAIGAEFQGQKAGTFGDAAIFSFYPNKQMTTGEGGVIVTPHEEWAALYRSLRNQGRDEMGTWLFHPRLGYNYRLDELSCALGLAQLERIEELLAKREQVAAMYNDRLSQMQGVEIPYISPTVSKMSWFVYVVRLAPELDREEVITFLQEHGIQTRPYFPPIHLQPFYRERFGYQEGDFPITEEIAQRTLALPFASTLEEEKIEYVCRTLAHALARVAI